MRKSIVGAVLALLVVAGVPAPPAHALKREAISLTPDTKVERSYPAIPGQNPTNQAQDSETCESSVYCDTIPLDIKVPADTPKDANYVIQVRLTWETRKANGTAVNDLDLFLEDTNREVLTKSATQAEPETLATSRPPSGRYYITVVNYLGDNPGYTIIAKYLADTAGNPFELLDEKKQGPPKESTVDPGSSDEPVDRSAEAPPFTFGDPPPLSDFDAAPDTSFDPSLFEHPTTNQTGFDGGELAAGGNKGKKIPPASGLAVFLSLVALPLLVVGGGGAMMWRRRAAGFSSL